MHATTQVSVRVDDPARILEVMAAVRSDPPTTIGGIAVASVDDLAAGADGMPPTDGMRFLLATGARVVIRPSGTEPKVKCYLQSVVPVGGGDLAAARAQADEELRAIGAEVSRWLE